jgi:peptidoglycan hydrolase CwlO-like protein
MNNKSTISLSAVKIIWTIVITVGIFAATLYTTQSVSNTKIGFLEKEVMSLKEDISTLSSAIDKVEGSQLMALADISQKLHQMELQLRELQVTLFILVDEKRGQSAIAENRSHTSSPPRN